MKHSWTRRISCGFLTVSMLTAMTFFRISGKLAGGTGAGEQHPLSAYADKPGNSAEELDSLVTDHAPAVAVLKVDSEGNTPPGRCPRRWKSWVPP